MKTFNKGQFLVLCGLLLAVAACNSRLTPTIAPLTASADPRADVTKAMRASLAAKTYRSRIVSTSSSGSDRTMTAEVVAPDRMHMTMQMDMPGRATVKSERIMSAKSPT